MVKRIIRNVPFLFIAIALSACGEGWERQLTNTVFPYGNVRTAGSGVAYVRAQMLPEKELKIIPVSRIRDPKGTLTTPVLTPEKEVKTMEPLFQDKMEK